MKANNAKPLEEGGVLDMGDPSNCTVYIGGVVAGTSELRNKQTNKQTRKRFNSLSFRFVIREAFKDVGTVVAIRQHDGFCFVDFATHDEALKAIMTKNGGVIGNKTVKLSWSKFRNEKGMPM